jgi:hypothetical protein
VAGGRKATGPTSARTTPTANNNNQPQLTKQQQQPTSTNQTTTTNNNQHNIINDRNDGHPKRNHEHMLSDRTPNTIA